MSLEKVFDSLDSTIDRKTSLSILLMCSTIVLASCDSRDTSNDDALIQSGSSNTAAGTVAGSPAESAASDTLQRSAADNASESLGVNLQSIVETMNGSSALGSAFTIPGLGLTTEPSPDGVFNDPTEPGPLVNPSFDARVRDESGSAFETSLGLSGQATTDRNGNTLTIDPDETELCAEQGEFVGSSICEQLMSDLRVTIVANTDQDGTINYLFQDQPVMVIGYSPTAASYELKLAGLHSVLVRVNELDPQAEPAPDTMTGAIKFEARILNSSVGSESGTMSFSISEAMSVIDSASGTDVTIEPSTLLEITSDAGTGAASIEVGIGAMSLTSRSDLAGNPLQRLVLAGLTARADVSANGNVLTVSNIGLGNGPLVMSVDSLESVRATLDTFGFTIDGNGNTIVLDGDLNYSAAFNNILGSLDETTSHDSTSSYTLSAASGTTFSEMTSGVMRVNQGGPLSLIYSIFDGSLSNGGSVSVNQGECFGERYNSTAPIDTVVCN